MSVLEKIRADIKRFQESIAELPNMMDSYCAVDFCLDVIDRYASEECDNDCEHCTYIECPKEPCDDACKKCLYAEETDGSHCYECVKGESKFEQEPCDTIAYNDDFATALQRMYEYEERQTEEPTGHWIKKDGYSDCSECGSHIVTEWDYCPKCGAKMVEPRERSDKE